MHRQEGNVEADEHQPEGDPPEAVGQRLAAHQREEIVEAGNHRKQHAADQYVVQVSDDEIGVVGLEVERRQRHHHAGQAAKYEDRQGTGNEQHRH